MRRPIKPARSIKKSFIVPREITGPTENTVSAINANIRKHPGYALTRTQPIPTSICNHHGVKRIHTKNNIQRIAVRNIFIY
jgi:hypothetical protein